ncbi:MAG TPA: substrate-binding domain-containing protein [Solirubrobacterales bacterium]|nr:substrate-binding domain-containing protein [Solirubrobacterales bacterium]
MSDLDRAKSARSRLRTGLATAATVAGLSAVALAPGTASAAPSCVGGNIAGTGSAMQQIAQQNVWGATFSAEVCNKGSFPKVAYNPSNSAAGMAAWNYDGELGEIDNEFAFVGTDMAPTAVQIESIKGVAGGSQLAVIPVVQTSIALVANPPEGCEIELITNSQLASVFEGKIYSWHQLEGVEGEAQEKLCEAPITRVVRKDPSGTSYQFKHYLYQLYKTGLFCTVGEGKATWQDLEPVSVPATGAPNTTWPETCAKKALSAVVRPSNGGEDEVVDKINVTAGSIGFAALPEAKANVEGNTVILRMQNNGQKKGGEANFAYPDSGSSANCGTQYQVPKINASLDLDWSQVSGAKPAIGGEIYPLCMLTYALAFSDYSSAGFTEAEQITTRDYLYEYVVQAAGQADTIGTYYAPLPFSSEPLFDVIGAARKAAKNISY